SIEIGAIKAVTGEEFPGANYQFTTSAGTLTIENIQVNGIDLSASTRVSNVDPAMKISAEFSEPLNPATSFEDHISLTGKPGKVALSFELSADNKTLVIQPSETINHLTKYNLEISNEIQKAEGYNFSGFQRAIYTAIDSTYKFPEISEEELLTLVQEQTFKYFWDLADPVSGMARERNSSGSLVTTG